jgi:hypothetical protein
LSRTSRRMIVAMHPKVPMANMMHTATFRWRLICKWRMKNNGRSTRRMSCTIAQTEFARGTALMSMHFPSMSRFQKYWTGVHVNTVKKIMMVELMMMPAPRI